MNEEILIKINFKDLNTLIIAVGISMATVDSSSDVFGIRLRDDICKVYKNFVELQSDFLNLTLKE